MNMLTTFFVRVFLLAAVAYLLVCLYVFFRQRTMLYHPQALSEDQMQRLAQETGMTRWLDKNGNLLGWMSPGDPKEIPVVIFHGNAGTALDRLPLVERLRAAGAKGEIHVAGYPGYGSTPGNPSQLSLTETAKRVLDAVSERAVVVGESLGTGVAAQAAKICPEKIRGIILITPFDSMVSAAARYYPWLPVQLLLLDRFNSVAALKTFRNPVAIILADNDDTTPPDGARRLFAALDGPKRLWEVKNAGHNDAFSNLSAEGWREIWEFATSGQK